MPNWCENDLKITGTREEVEAFLAFAKGEDSDFDFRRFIPEPDRSDGGDSDIDVWAWRIANWGTKWPAISVDAGEHRVYKVSAEVTLHFNTAWSPPIPVVLAASLRFPRREIELRYFECGVGFHGIFRAESGQVLDARCVEYFGGRGG